MNAREDHVTAVHLLLHLDEVGHVLHQKRWAEVAALAEYVAHDVPLDLAQTDPALFTTLRAAITQYHLRGLTILNPKKLRALAAAQVEAKGD